ncbi:PilN family type IVB pilus formation outer membrane protein [Achromobacter insuavis]|uniref:PilN family type IVB pilus formation outer membrane protein n=1 Tax=Achromobacter insuavis TaxID=1287735 RepID=UPI001F14203F|nr:PilN family type IVB pilus formation outer membrane protein [Achromobacter insuavis]
MKFKTIAACLALLLTVQGCAPLERINNKMDAVVDTHAEAVDNLSAVRKQRASPLKIDDRPWVSKEPIPVASTANLDPALKCPMTYASSRPVSIYQLAQIITSVCNVPVRISPDVQSAGMIGQRPGASTYGAGQQPLPPLAPPGGGAAGQPPMVFGQSGAGGFAPRDMTVSDLVWQGKPLAGFLDAVTARLGLSWSFKGGAVQISYLQTRVFRLWARGGETGLETNVTTGNTVTSATPNGAGGGNTTTGVGSSQTTRVSMKSDIVKDIKTNIDSMLTPAGRSSFASSTGALTITDTPEAIERIATYIEAENVTITRNVLLNIKVLEVTLSDRDALGLDWSVVYKSLSGNYGINLAGTAGLASDVISGSVSVLDTATGDAKQFSGSKAIIQALSTQGNVQTVREPSVTTLNLRTAPVQISKDTTYVAQSSQTNTANVGSQQSLTPGVVTTGFSMNLLPFITEGNEMLLDFSMNFSPDPTITPVKNEKGEIMLEKPEIERRLFQQSTKIRSGQTLVLSGFEERADLGSKRGVGSAGNWWLGGGGTASGRKLVVVILVTPLILD